MNTLASAPRHLIFLAKKKLQLIAGVFALTLWLLFEGSWLILFLWMKILFPWGISALLVLGLLLGIKFIFAFFQVRYQQQPREILVPPKKDHSLYYTNRLQTPVFSSFFRFQGWLYLADIIQIGALFLLQSQEIDFLPILTVIFLSRYVFAILVNLIFFFLYQKTTPPILLYTPLIWKER